VLRLKCRFVRRVAFPDHAIPILPCFLAEQRIARVDPQERGTSTPRRRTMHARDATPEPTHPHIASGKDAVATDTSSLGVAGDPMSSGIVTIQKA
jgi:hypothetical protein